jgi:hypothetical protein
MLKVPKEVLSFMVDKTATLSFHEERRQHPRFSVKLPLDYWETPEIIRGGLVGNISETGLLMHSVHRIQVGTKLRIRVYISEGNSLDCIEGNSKIVWMNLHREQGWKGYRYGAYIMQMPPDYQDTLRQYILMLQDEESSPNRRRSSNG